MYPKRTRIIPIIPDHKAKLVEESPKLDSMIEIARQTIPKENKIIDDDFFIDYKIGVSIKRL